MNIKTNGGSTRDYAKEPIEPIEPSEAARKSIAALGYDLRASTYDSSWALELNGFLHSDWMTLHEVEAFAAGIDRTLWHLGLDEAAYRVADRDRDRDKKTDKYDGPCDRCDCCKDDAADQHHDVTMFQQHFIEWADDIMDDMVRTFNLDSKEE